MSTSVFTISDFMRKYPDNDSCLEEIVRRKFSDFKCVCGRTKLYRVKGRPVYACACGKQIHPLSGTIFANTKVPLTHWFYAMYVMTNAKSGVSAALLQRHLGVKYDTAWRMMHKIRELMADDEPLKGDIEADETYFRAKPWRTVRPLAYNGRATSVFGMVERGGRAKAVVIPTNSKKFLLNEIRKNVPKGSTVYTDAFQAYNDLSKDYIHYSVVHSRGEYVDGHKYTNNIENVFSHMKRGIYGVYRSVRPHHLQKYLDEFTWRYSNRSSSDLFSALLLRL